MTREPWPVVVVGGGPVGLATAMRLGHAGVPCLVLEAETAVPRELRASTFHPPTLEMLDEQGLTPALLAQGLVAPTWQVRMHARDGVSEFAEFDLGLLKHDTRHPYRLQCEQWRLSELLIAHLARELPGVELRRGARVQGLRQHDGFVELAVDGTPGPTTVRARHVVGADGARSAVRQALGLPFEGQTFPETTVLATTAFPLHEALPDLSFINYCWSPQGTFSLLRLRDRWRVSLYPDEGESVDDALGEASLRAKLARIHPALADGPVGEVRAYRIHQRVVERYVHGRVALAGDAAHLNSPSGGMGMNGGLHDAFNLADKLARIHRGESGDLLALYDRQRRPVAVRHVLEQSGANRARMQQRDPAARREALAALQRTAADPVLAREHLLRSSMIAGLREAAAVT